MLSDWRPDDEMLAAFIDGKLTSADRARVVQALASNPDYCVEFMEVARIADAAHGGLQQSSPVAPRVTSGWR